LNLPSDSTSAPACLRTGAATHEEHRVAAKERARIREPKGDVAARMAGHVENARLVAGEIIALAVGERGIDAGDARPIGGRPDDDAACGCLEFEVPAGVVGVMMRIEDVRQTPASLAQGLQNRSRNDGSTAAVAPLLSSWRR